MYGDTLFVIQHNEENLYFVLLAEGQHQRRARLGVQEARLHPVQPIRESRSSDATDQEVFRSEGNTQSVQSSSGRALK